MNKKIPLYQPYLTQKEKNNVKSCLEDNWISSKGRFIKKFENNFKKKFNYKYSTVTTNGTTALHLAVLALNLKKGDEVIVPNLTYVAPCNAVTYSGAKIVLADVNIDTWLMDKKTISKYITKKTKAILLVHLYGFTYNFDEIRKLKNKYNLKIIEDCAEAIGSKYKESYVGKIGDISTFSFYGNKTITTGEGGMVVTKEKKLYDKIVKLKSQGLNIKKKNNYYNHEILGYNYRMTNICSAIGDAQLEKINYLIKRKKQINTLYQKNLKNTGLQFQKDIRFSSSTYWLVNILFKNKYLKNKVEKLLSKKNIETRPIFKPINRLKMYKKGDNNYKNSIEIYSRGISLPSYPDLTNKQIKYICSNIIKFIKSKK
tara:strand:+ start:219 stop:1331 length:1113 start_codon:yes stop_codon:yes gene_type:complete